jgi:hypothetical protein
MLTRKNSTRAVPSAARVFSGLQAEDVLLPGQVSVLRRSGALFLTAMVLISAPLFWAANAAGVIGDLPAAVAHGGNSGPGGGDDHDDDDGAAGPAGDDDDSATAWTDDTSANGADTRGTTNDNDTRTVTGTGS